MDVLQVAERSRRVLRSLNDVRVLLTVEGDRIRAVGHEPDCPLRNDDLGEESLPLYGAIARLHVD